MSLGSERGVLLVNLGSPDSPSVKDVRKYLNQFLMDERVIDAPYLVRRMIVSCFILPFRPRRSAEAYESIWTDEGSPLIVISRRVQTLLQQALDIPVGLGMRYGSPSIEEGLKSLLRSDGEEPREILLVPLYPHYAMSSYETVVVETQRVISKIGYRGTLEVLPPFYDDPDYIEALVASARDYLNSDYDRLLFSYHGLPERHLRKSDPTGEYCLSTEDCCFKDSPVHQTCYRAQVFRTTKAFVQKAGIPEGKYSVAFQSRLGRDPWLQPFADVTISRLASEGIKKLIVICPAFVSDCLETLEEIGIRGRRTFLEAGGEELRLVPCLNDHPRWIESLAKWCSEDSRT